MKKEVTFRDLGLITYKEAWDYQEQLFKSIVEKKLENDAKPASEKADTGNYLLFCEHPHVFTLGKSGSEQNLLVNLIQLRARDAEFYHTNRGGDITYHGPGQIVGYPVLNLDDFVKGVKEYIEKLEEAVILTLNDYGLRGERLKGATGVWMDTELPGKTRKICAIGVRTSRWVSMHGFAFNVNTDLSYFSLINPCGFVDKAVTSLEKELGAPQDFTEAKNRVKNHIAEIFGMEFRRM